MIGWVPHLLSAFIEEVAGPAVRREVLAAAGSDPDLPFRLDATYADAACRRILDVACARLGVTEEAAFEAFAPFFLARSRAAFPGFFAHRPDVRDFLLHQPEVHNTLAAGLAEGEREHVARKFRAQALPGGVRIFYRSPNRLAGLYAAVARRLGEECGQTVTVVFEAGCATDEECIIALAVGAREHAAPIPERIAA